MAIVQAKRLLRIFTPFEENFLLMRRLHAEESISQLFRFELDLVHEETVTNYKPTPIEATKILGQLVTVTIQHRNDEKRFFHGIVTDFSQGHRDKRFSYYKAVLQPEVWLLTQNIQSRIFQHVPVPEILKKIFEGYNVKFEIQGTFEPRDYCVQYRESDFAFASRLMEEEGIYYYFEHTQAGHKMIIANTPLSHRDVPGKSDIPYFVEVTTEQDFFSAVGEFEMSRQLQTGKFVLWDHCFELPGKNLEVQQPTRFVRGTNHEVEIYDFPGGYAQRFDGVAKDGSERSADLQKIFEDGRRTVQLRMQEVDSQYRTAQGSSDCVGFTAGHRFRLTQHKSNRYNQQYVLVSVSHEATQTPDYISNDEVERAYNNTFTCLLTGSGQAPYRPPRNTKKPSVAGCQTATVVGPSGEEIFTDKYGRVKIQFHWDRDGKNNADSSCWVRVAQMWAGKKWGSMYIPRIGQEVIVDFLEGDPDQPIIVGSVYNAEEMPFYDLPKFKTLSYIKSNSSPNAKGFNELRFEDKAGKEQIFMHSQLRMDVRVRGSVYETCGGNRQISIGMKSEAGKPGGNLALSVGGNMDVHIKADLYEGIDGKHNRTVKGNVVWDFQGNLSVVVKSKTEINAREITLEGSQKVTLKVGSSFIVVDMMGVTIQGPMVKINSGGAASPTSPVSIDDPLDAEPADTGEPGYLDKPRTGGGRAGRNRRTLNGQHAPAVTRKKDGTYQVGAVKVVGSEAYQQKVLNDLSTMSNTKEGQKLMKDLKDTGKEVTIKEMKPPPNPPNAFAEPGTGKFADYQKATPAGQPVFDGGGNPLNDSSGNQLIGTGTGGDSQVSYNPNQWPDPTSKSKAPGDVILFHELQHSKNQMGGTYDGTPRTDGFDTNEEFNAIGPENKYRDERGVPRRTDHHDL